MTDSAFKNIYNEESVTKMATALSRAYPKFNKKEFIALAKQFPPLEMKDRVLVLTDGLKKNLPSSYQESAKILIEVINEGELTGFLLWPVSEFISQHGRDDFDKSMEAMYFLTQKFTSEFAIRPYLLTEPKKVLGYFRKWVKDPNVHVRRWVSEGTRPVLPWGGKIPLFIQSPEHTLPLLEALKFDEELYVRKSVSNHLNDISKTHPKLVIQTLSKWESEAPEKHREKIVWIKRQALRTLIKAGDKDALRLMGATSEAKVLVSEITLNKKKFKIGDTLEFSFDLESSAKKKQKIVVDYVIHFMKSNGKTNGRVFKLKTFEIESLEKIKLTKKHGLRKITTMVYYKGLHTLSIQVNGKIVATIDWDFHP